jgi:thiamine biosynthesis protein ThiI
VILVRYGEIMLKGLNRRMFEERLAQNLKAAVRPFGAARAEIGQGRIFLEPRDPSSFDFAAAAPKAAEVFGTVSVSVALRCGTDPGDIHEAARACVAEYVASHAPSGEGGRYPFKVETKRGQKSYPRKSPEISRDAGAFLMDAFPDALAVDVNRPQFVLDVEVRESAYVYIGRVEGFGGLPLGTNGKATLLLSGGIDSPVAGFMMAKRGVQIEACHFYSYPYTGERSREKVVRLCEILAGYTERMRVLVVPFTEIQLAIRDHCDEDYSTVVTRRSMMRVATALARESGAQALVTGEAMGQVASQTIMALACTDDAAGLPVFRPLIGMDKREVVAMAERIGTFETSILPYEDCCTVFTPKHPKTRPRLEDVLAEEAKAPGLARMEAEAAAKAEAVEARRKWR